MTSTTAFDRTAFVLPAPPVEDWWSDYRRFGVGEACGAVASWSQDGDITDPESDRGRRYLECSEQDWPTYFFKNWFDFEQWELFTTEELIAIHDDLLESMEVLEGLIENLDETSSGGARELVLLAIDRARADKRRIEAFLDEN